MAALLALAFLARLAAVAAITGLHTAPTPGSDEFEYDTYAWNVAQGNGYRGPSPNVEDHNHLTAYRPPAPSLLFAGLYVLFGHNPAVVYVADAVLGALTVWLVFRITLRCFDERAAWVAAAFYAFYPIAIYYGLTLNSETFSTFLVCLFVWCCLGIKDERAMRWTVGAGLSLGLILLSKPAFVFLLPLLPLWAWSVCGRRIGLWRRAVAIPFLAAALLAPWIVRNLLVMHAFIPFSTGGGSLLLQANNRQVIEDPSYAGYAVFDFCLPEYAKPITSVNDELKRDAIAKRFAIQWLRANPDKWFYLVRSKFVRLWRPEYTGVHFHGLAWTLMVSYGAALVAFALTVLPFSGRMLRERHPGSILVCMILATIASALIFHGQHRYRFPIDCLCISIGAGGVFWLWDAAHRHSRRQWPAEVHQTIRRHGLIWGVACVLAAGLALWWRADNRHIESWREAVCQNRLKAIERAALAYQKAHGELPPRLSMLVPEFLPNVEALHCPKDTISYSDHALLPSTDAGSCQRLISYSWLMPRTASEEPCIVENGARHGGESNGVTLSGRLFADPAHAR